MIKSKQSGYEAARDEFNDHLEFALHWVAIGVPSVARKVREDADTILDMRLKKIEIIKAA